MDPAHSRPFEIGTEGGRRDWRRLPAIERDLVLADARPGDLASDLADYLYVRSTGHFASLMTFITRGCRRAITTGQERLSEDLLDGIRICSVRISRGTCDAEAVIDDDPGWRFSWRTLLMAIPGIGPVLRRRSARRNQDGLVVLREVFTAFCLAIGWFGVVVVALYPSEDHPHHPPAGVAVGLLIAGGVAALVGPRVERPLDCTDDRRLAASYRVRFFLR
ncbi:MAG: hypothetical protein LC749_17725, partial [Actinobacteria bacterium]|nr:hypothetical protein [Actinomycetota bacterium]